MKATKLLAVLLAVLMVIPAMVMPTAAEETAQAAAEPDYGITRTYGFTPLGADKGDTRENAYLVQHGGGRRNDASPTWGGRNGEGNGTIWKFPLYSTSTPAKVTIKAYSQCELWVLAAVNGGEYVTAYNCMEDPTVQWRPGVEWRTFDLTAAVAASMATSEEIPEYIYVKLADPAVGTKGVGGYTAMDGYGGAFIQDSEVTMTICYDDSVSENIERHIFHPNGGDDANYIVQNNANKNATGYYTDGTGLSVTFGYPLCNSELPEKLLWTAKLGGYLKLDFSVDTFHWVNVFDQGTEKYIGTKTWMTFDLAKFYAQESAKYPSSMIYIKVSNSKDGAPEGWGGAIGTPTEPTTLTAVYPEKKLTGETITLDWSVGDKHCAGEDESLYWLGGISFNGGYYADCHYKGVMFYPLTNVDLSSQVLLTMNNTQQLLLEVSLDNANWTEAFRYNNVGGNAPYDKQNNWLGFQSADRTFDLTAAIAKAAEIATSKDGLYVRIGDSHPTKLDANGNYTDVTGNAGWGGRINANTDVVLNVRSATGMEYGHVVRQDVIEGPIKMRTDGDYNGTYQFTATPDLPWVAEHRGGLPWAKISPDHVDATGATPILNGGVGRGNSTIKNAGTSNYYADGGYYVLRYELPEGANTWQFTATIGNKFGLYVAYGDMTAPHPITDSDRYTKLAAYTDFGLSGQDTYITNYTITKTASEQELANGRYVYLLFADDPWYQGQLTGNPVAGGYGAAILLGKKYPVTMRAYISTDDILGHSTETVNETVSVSDDFTVSAVQKNSWDDAYSLVNGGPKRVDSACTSVIAYAIAAADVKGDAETGFYYEGNGTWTGEVADEGKVFVYRYALPAGTTHFDWSATVAGEYKIEMAYSDTTLPTAWTQAAIFTEWDDGAHGHNGESTTVTISKDVLAEDFAKGGYVYLRFTDADPADGWGGRVCLGSKYPVKMTYKCALGTTDAIQSVKKATPTLTNNINLTFELAMPISAKTAENVTITWADGTPVSWSKLNDTTYIVKDILPQQMTQDLVINYNGICMDNTKYTAKTFSYSIKDYCERMILKTPADSKLVTLLSDALAYGEAAQNYVQDATSELPTAGVKGLKPSTFNALNAADYANILSEGANASDAAYKWAGVTLVLDNTVAIRYSIYSVNGDEPAVKVNGNAVTLVNDGNGFYHVDVPVMAGSFATNYVASFDAIEGSTLTYSVNHYVARKYDPSQKLTSALIAALYNYGASAAAYAAK